MPEWQIDDGEWRRGKSRWAYQGGNGANRRRRMGSAASPGRQTSAQFVHRLSLSCALRYYITARVGKSLAYARGIFFAPSSLGQVEQMLRRITFTLAPELTLFQRQQSQRKGNNEVEELAARGFVDMR